MMRPAKMAMLLVALVALSGCASINPSHPQAAAGINKAVADFYQDGSLKHVEVIGGKESAKVRFTMSAPGGLKATYAATDVRAFEAQEVRAAVETVLLREMGTAAPKIVDAVVRAVIGTAGIGAAGQLLGGVIGGPALPPGAVVSAP